MNINFNWKFSHIECPKNNEKVIIAINSYGMNILVVGKFAVNNNFINFKEFIGREITATTIINLDSVCVYTLPERFVWDYFDPKFKFPDIKEIRKEKLEKLSQ